MKKPLTEILPGTRAYVTDLERVDAVLRRRLIDLGVMEGSEITIKRILPFGGPLAVEANGQSIGIRRREASKIEVEVR